MQAMKPTAEHLAFRKALEEVMKQHSQAIDAVELLAIASHMVGQLIALQDQRRWNSEQIMQLVTANIQAGNTEVVDRLVNEQGGSA